LSKSGQSNLFVQIASGLPAWDTMFRCFGQPRLQYRNVARLNRGEGDAHPRAWPRIRDHALGGENRTSVGDSDPDARSVVEWRGGPNKAAEDAQVLGVRRDLGLGVERRHLYPGDEWETLRAMAVERNGTTVVSENSIPTRDYDGHQDRCRWRLSEQSNRALYSAQSWRFAPVPCDSSPRHR
jgi:hypothetical protein